MNIKQQAIEAGIDAFAKESQRGAQEGDDTINPADPWTAFANAFLAVLADPENWTDEMEVAVRKSVETQTGPRRFTVRPQTPQEEFAAVINHVKGLPT